MQEDRYSPTNTCSRSPQCNQIISYTVYLTQTLIFFILLQPNYESLSVRVAMIVMFVVSLVCLIVAGVGTSIIDPADSIMVQFRNGDRKNVLAVIDSCLYCDSCHSYVSSTSRHCKICNRCVSKFDHHCIWINNCIGDQNYKYFIVMIVSALSNLAVFVIAVGLLWGEQRAHLYYSAMIVSFVMFVVSLVFSLLLLGLLVLHVFLICKGLTTFQFIMFKRENQKIIKENINIHLTKINQKTQQNIIPTNNQMSVLTDQIVFRQSDGRTSQSHSSGQLHPKQSSNYPKNNIDLNTLPINADSQEKELRLFYQRHRSLKMLVGNAVATKPYSERTEQRKYSSNKFMLQPNNQNSKHNNQNSKHDIINKRDCKSMVIKQGTTNK